MKKDIYVMIPIEYRDDLFQIKNFIPKAEYKEKDRAFYSSDFGKISTSTCDFRFVPYVHIDLK